MFIDISFPAFFALSCGISIVDTCEGLRYNHNMSKTVEKQIIF